MKNRKEKIKKLIEKFHTLKNEMSLHTMVFKNMPRVTPAQLSVIMLIKQHKKSTVKEIATILCITSSATTQLIQELVDNGHVLRETGKKDRRMVMLSLSKKTEKLAIKIENYIVNNFLELFKGLNEAEFDQYITLNEKIINNPPKKVVKCC